MREVVVAVIVENGRMLLTQRVPGKRYPYLWENPGGKVEPGEAPAEALRRELQEELGCASTVHKPVLFVADFTVVVEHTRTLYATKRTRDVSREMSEPTSVLFLRADLRSAPTMKASIGLGWFAPGDLASFYNHDRLTPATLALVDALEQKPLARHLAFDGRPS